MTLLLVFYCKLKDFTYLFFLCQSYCGNIFNEHNEPCTLQYLHIAALSVFYFILSI